MSITDWRFFINSIVFSSITGSSDKLNEWDINQAFNFSIMT